MLSDAQANYIKESFSVFAKSLDEKQLKRLYFRLDDLLLYSHNSLQIAHSAVSKVRSDREYEQIAHTVYHVIKGD